MLGRPGLSLRQCVWSVDQPRAWSPESGSIDMIYKTDWEPPQGAGQAPHSVPQPVHTSPAPSHGDPRVGQVPPLCSQLSPVVNWGPGALPSLNLLASSPQPARPLPPHSGPPPRTPRGLGRGLGGAGGPPGPQLSLTDGDPGSVSLAVCPLSRGASCLCSCSPFLTTLLPADSLVGLWV